MTVKRGHQRTGDSAAGAAKQMEGRIKALGAIVMAAGLGNRMRSKLVKVLHPVAGRPMVLYGVELAERHEQVAQVLVGDADAGVLDLDAERVGDEHGAVGAHRERLAQRVHRALG